MKIAFLSDTHGYWIDVESCDLIIHCGDAFHSGKNLIQNRIQWESVIKYQFKKWREIAPFIYVPGNHDMLFQHESRDMWDECQALNIYLLDHRIVKFRGLDIFGTPWQKNFYNWAFNLDEKELRHKYSTIQKCDILVSHAPCYKIFDRVTRIYSSDEDPDGADKNYHVGDKHLLEKVLEIQPKIFAAGHLHANYGVEKICETTFIGCSIVDESYQPARNPIYIEI